MKSLLGIPLLSSQLVALACLQAATLNLAFAQRPTATDTMQNQPKYTITALGTLPGCAIAVATGINDLGQVVGQSSGADCPTLGLSGSAFLWENGNMMDLGTLPGRRPSYASAINNKTQIVGQAGTFSDGVDNTHAFLWQNGHIGDLGTLGGPISYATAINNNSQVTGYSLTMPHGIVRAFLWQNGKMTSLGGVLDEGGSFARGINNKGQIVGASVSTAAFLWQDGKVTELGSLFGSGRGEGIPDVAVGINDKSQVVGHSDTNDVQHGFLWQNGHLTDLGTLAGAGTLNAGCLGEFAFCSSNATAINNEGQVVGWSDTIKRPEALLGVQHAFLWQNGKMTDLNDLLPAASGWELNEASAINNRGQIAGGGTRNGQLLQVYLLTPIHIVNATLQISLPSWRFAAHPVGQTSGPATIWIYNSGPDAVDFNVIQFAGGDPQDFAIAGNTCASTLAPFTVCKVIFHFSPTAAGERTASLSLNDNAQDGPHAIPVQGFGSSK